jgi:hypothetical protein
VDEAQETLEQRIAALPRELGGLELRLRLPLMVVDRDDVYAAWAEIDGSGQVFARLAAAALLLCWAGSERARPARMADGSSAAIPQYGGKILKYGGQAYGFLLGLGVSRADILRVGGVAVAMCVEAAVAQHHARQEARDFSGAPGAGQRSDSSGSSAPGGANQGGSGPSTTALQVS